LREGEEKERRGEAAESAVEEQVVESEDGRVLTQGSHMEMGGGRRRGRDGCQDVDFVRFSVSERRGRKEEACGVALVSASLSFRFVSAFRLFRFGI
jgi:hypothetical protein